MPSLIPGAPAPTGSTPVQAIDVGIDGMTCASCVGRVERALRKVPGAQDVTVNLATESARVVAPPELEGALRRAVRNAGYTPRAADAQGAALAAAPGWRDALPVGLAVLLSLPLVLPMAGDLLGRHWMLPAWLQFVLATPVQFVLGARFYRAGWQALKAGSGNMDLLVATGTTAAWGLSTWLWLTAHAGHVPHLYFESSAVVITLVLLGKWMEARSRRQTTDAIRALHALRPDTARLLVRGGPEEGTEVPVAEVQPGDRLVVLAGERIALDGEVVEGRTQVDESMLTGESLPVEKGPGGTVSGGAINGDGRIVMQVTATGAQTVLARIIRLVEDAQTGKAPVQRLVDRVSAVFVPVVVVIALATLLGWWWWGAGVEVAVIHAVAVLVIACPCSLGLATPAAIVTGTGAAARRGILFKDVEALEVAHRVDTVAFDKTGTLTCGTPRLQSAAAAPGSAAQPGLSEEQLIALAAALQSASDHPLAQAVRDAATASALPAGTVTDARSVPGYGSEAEVDGVLHRLGSLRWMGELNASLGALADEAARLQRDGATVSAVARQTASAWDVLGLLAFADTPRPGAKEAVQALRVQGLKVLMVSGDNPGAANAMARQLGMDPDGGEVLANVLPGDKAAAIGRLQAEGRVVAMVGDGINDAPALAAADVGIAMGSGTDVAMHAAGITLMRGDTALVAAAFDISRRTVRTIRQNLFWALVYNLAGIPLAAMGYLSPVVAGAAMALSSVCVLGNSLLLRRWR